MCGAWLCLEFRAKGGANSSSGGGNVSYMLSLHTYEDTKRQQAVSGLRKRENDNLFAWTAGLLFSPATNRSIPNGL